MNFHLTPNPEKSKYKILEKLKNPYFLAILGSFCTLLGKNDFSQKIRLSF